MGVRQSAQRFKLCIVRHEMPSEGDSALSQQNIQDRYHGKNDPVAQKLLGRIQKSSPLQPPADKTIVSKTVNKHGSHY